MSSDGRGDEWLLEWASARFPRAPVRVEALARLPLAGELVVWHPLEDLYAEPRLTFREAADLEAVWAGAELVGYVLRNAGVVATWRELGDASTDTDRFFLLESAQSERVIDWFNERLSDFEQLGGDEQAQTVERGDGTRMVVIRSPDGNARVRGGFAADGTLVVALIET